MNTPDTFSIFLVDDDKLFVTSLSNQLKNMFKFETNIRTFSTGEECLKNFDPPPDLILLDYFLNGNSLDAMNGLQVLRKVISKSPDTKVIMMSAQDKIEVAVNLIKYGAYDYIIKNDKINLRVKLAVSNAAGAVSTSKELKKVKLLIKIVTGIIIGVVAGCALISIFFPTLFTKG